MYYYSNCLIMALLIRYRLGGKLVAVSSAFGSIPHFMVLKSGRFIDFSCRNKDDPSILWFEGKLRKKRSALYKQKIWVLF